MAPRETENNAYAKFWSDQQRVLWYVISWSGQLGEPFAADRFTNRNITLLQKDRVITTSKHVQSNTVSIQARLNKDRKRTEISKCYGCLFLDSIFHPLLRNLKKSMSLRERAQLKQSPKKYFNAWKKK